MAALKDASKTPGTAPVPGAKATLRPAPANSLTLREQGNNDFRLVVDAGLTPEQLADSAEFWTLIASDLRCGDVVTAIAGNRAWLATFCVLDAGEGFASVALMWSARCPMRTVSAAKEIPEGWQILRTGPEEDEGWYALHTSGRRIMESGYPFKTFELARTGLLTSAIFAQPESIKRLP